MGSLSELGPIDPQIGDLPALGLKYAVEHLAELVKRYPAASSMFAQYLSNSLRPIDLGYYERVAESAVQYAERLLHKHVHNLQRKPGDVANHLVYAYKDHSFVIDTQEALSIFGTNVVKSNTDEYKLGNSLYESIVQLNGLARLAGKTICWSGSIESDFDFLKKKQD